MLQSAAQIQQGVTISVEKNIPSQAGMGGGSSDAASTLVALNRLWNLNWPMSKLLKLALNLGADVPFFIRARNAFVQGIGEILTPVEIEAAHFLVVKPSTGIETHRIFTDPDLHRSTKNATMPDFAEHIFDFGRNDLQPVAERLCPDVRVSLEWLSSQGLHPRMSGSGSSVFAKCSPSWNVPPVPKDWQVRLCSNLEKHPLEGWVSCDVF
jgi:4-diphosphocytidyl-2-C-methyl-D-erythritol kinase